MQASNQTLASRKLNSFEEKTKSSRIYQNPETKDKSWDLTLFWLFFLKSSNIFLSRLLEKKKNAPFPEEMTLEASIFRKIRTWRSLPITIYWIFAIMMSLYQIGIYDFIWINLKPYEMLRNIISEELPLRCKYIKLERKKTTFESWGEILAAPSHQDNTAAGLDP